MDPQLTGYPRKSEKDGLEHRYWRHPRVTVLPHVAALTDVCSGAQVVAANLRALREGAPLMHLVDRARGY